MVIELGEVQAWVAGFDPGLEARATSSRDAVLTLIRSASGPLRRDCFAPGHVTASGLVLSRDGAHVLLVYHPRLRRWLQPGGHLEPGDRSVPEAAEREVREETGVAIDRTVAPVLVAVDVHDIPAAGGEPAHRHHDLMFRFQASVETAPRPVGGHRWTWCRVEKIGEYHVDEPLRGAVRRALGIEGRL